MAFVYCQEHYQYFATETPFNRNFFSLRIFDDDKKKQAVIRAMVNALIVLLVLYTETLNLNRRVKKI